MLRFICALFITFVHLSFSFRGDHFKSKEYRNLLPVGALPRTPLSELTVLPKLTSWWRVQSPLPNSAFALDFRTFGIFSAFLNLWVSRCTPSGFCPLLGAPTNFYDYSAVSIWTQNSGNVLQPVMCKIQHRHRSWPNKVRNNLILSVLWLCPCTSWVQHEQRSQMHQHQEQQSLSDHKVTRLQCYGSARTIRIAGKANSNRCECISSSNIAQTLPAAMLY